MAKVTMYSTPTCAFCHMAKEYFASKNIEVEDINIADPANEEGLRYVIEQSGQAATPYIVIGDKGILGFDRVKIDAALEKLNSKSA